MDKIVKDCQYELGGKPRGLGIIIVNSFDEFRIIRKGAGYEKEKLHQLFDLMGLEVLENKNDLTKDQIGDWLHAISRDPRLKTDSMIAIALSSHGCEEGLLGVNVEERLDRKVADETKLQDYITPNQIRNYFNGLKCPALAKKPKFIILNGCRGSGREEVIECDNMPNIPQHMPTTYSDFFTVHSCEPGTISLRTHAGGSIFIDVLLETYKELGKDLPLELMMPIVNRRLIHTCATKARHISSQSCTWESSCCCVLKISPHDDVPPQIQQVPIQPIEDQFKLVWATCTKGTQGPNQMSTPSGLTITPTGQIYITDSAAKCIWIYSTDGEPIFQDIDPKDYKYKQLVIHNPGLTYAWGLCLYQNFLFVSCTIALIKFSLLAGGLLTHKFLDTPLTGMDVDKKGVIYACERHSCKMLLLDLELNIKSKLDLTHTLNPAHDRLMDVKLVENELYVLVSQNAYAIQVFGLAGNHLRNLVSSNDLKESLYFAIDRTKKTIFAGDIATHELKAFSADGRLMHITGQHGDKRGNLAEPGGIDITADGEVVVVSPSKTKYMLQSFKLPPM